MGNQVQCHLYKSFIYIFHIWVIKYLKRTETLGATVHLTPFYLAQYTNIYAIISK